MRVSAVIVRLSFAALLYTLLGSLLMWVMLYGAVIPEPIEAAYEELVRP